MSLTQILYPAPEPQGLEMWMYDHVLHHQAIISAAQIVFNVQLTLYPIYPFNPNDVETWLDNHQQMHYDMDGACGIQANDLSDVNFSDSRQLAAWMQLNWLEHQGCAGVLGNGT